MQYSGVCIFHKRTNLLPYFYSKYNYGDFTSSERYDRAKARYANERDVQLILLIRYDGKKTICRIKCPINPIPVKGEFEASSMQGIFDFLRQHGWAFRETYNLSIFQ